MSHTPIRLGQGPVEVSRNAFGRPAGLSERTRLIIDAAARRFETRGFHGTSLQDVADDIGITKAALYHYFSSKDELLYLTHDVFISTMLDAAEEFVANHDDPLEQLDFYIRNILTTVAEYGPYVRAFFRDYGVLQGELAEQIHAKRDRYEELVEECIARGVEQGAFRPDLDPRMAALFLFGACNWSYQWLKPDGKMNAEQIAASWYEMLMGGFRHA